MVESTQCQSPQWIVCIYTFRILWRNIEFHVWIDRNEASDESLYEASDHFLWLDSFFLCFHQFFCFWVKKHFLKIQWKKICRSSHFIEYFKMWITSCVVSQEFFVQKKNGSVFVKNVHRGSLVVSPTIFRLPFISDILSQMTVMTLSSDASTDFAIYFSV